MRLKVKGWSEKSDNVIDPDVVAVLKQCTAGVHVNPKPNQENSHVTGKSKIRIR